MDATVHIEGDGVAAACCARLLSASGQRFSCSRVARPRVGSVLLSRQTRLLLGDLCPEVDLDAVCHPIHKRIVAWGPGAVPVSLPHAAWVISEADLLNRLWIPVSGKPGESTEGWRIVTTGHQQRAFGARIATVTSTLLKRDIDQDGCWIESVDSGWLFLLPRGPNHPATLIAVGDTPAALVSQSRLIAAVVDSIDGAIAQFPAYPRIAFPLGSEGWLACGAAAMALDPLCGEGTGNAARQAYLATAVIGAARDGQPVDDLLAHYASRQMHGFLRHLQLCLTFYQTGGTTKFWRSETALLEEGIEWTQRLLQEARPATHRLVGRRLQPV